MKKLLKLRGWFYSNFQDPVENCPHESREGGYQYIWGGPYDAREQIEGQFGGIVPDSIIDKVVEELNETCWEWSGMPEDHSD